MKDKMKRIYEEEYGSYFSSEEHAVIEPNGIIDNCLVFVIGIICTVINFYYTVKNFILDVLRIK